MKFFAAVLALASIGAVGPVPIERGTAHPVIVRKVQRQRAMAHARRGGRR